jgi:hypothetical protein
MSTPVSWATRCVIACEDKQEQQGGAKEAGTSGGQHLSFHRLKTHSK